MDVTDKILLDSQGQPMVSDDAVPEARVLDCKELTALTGGIIRFLVSIAGVEAMQLVFMHAAAIEETLPDDDAVVEPEFGEAP